MKKISLLLLTLTVSLSLYAQQKTISGVVYEEVNGEKVPLPFANVFVPGTTRGTTSDIDGKYILSVTDQDKFAKVSFIGYGDIQEKIPALDDANIVIDFTMSQGGGVALDDVVVVARKNTESESVLMIEQKNAVKSVEYIGSQNMSIQGVSDAAGAVTKLSGISKQEGSKSLNVRGLGDRYNTTTLNGLPLPSNNPELKNFDLGLFNSDVISHIEVEKTYNSNLNGDFGGANIDINSKVLNDDQFLEVALAYSLNSNVLLPERFFLASVGNTSGFYNGDNPNTDAIVNGNSYNFENSWNPNTHNPFISGSAAITGGKKYDIGDGELRTFFNISFDSDYNYTEKIERVANASGFALTDLQGTEFSYNTQTTGLLNLNFTKDNSSYYFNSLFVNGSEQELTTLYGEIRDVSANKDGLVRRGQFQRNTILVNQLLGTHNLDEKTDFEWGLSYNTLTNTVPDRQQNTYEVYDPNTNIGELDPFSSGRNFRYYQSFDENEIAANLNFSRKFGLDKENDTYKGKWNVGYSGKFKFRNFNSVQYNHQVFREANNQNIRVDINDVDSFLNEQNYLNNRFDVKTIKVNGEHGFKYNGYSYVNGGFGLLEYNINNRLNMLTGLRVENIHQSISYLSSQNTTGLEESTQFNKLSVLPSVSFKYRLNDKANLRLAASKTYTLPQLQEMPLIVFEGISDDTYGNPYIYPSDVYNTDLKWEYFPKNGEMFSATTFGKYIVNPINKFAANSSFSEYTSANTGDWGYVYGIELEARKTLFNFSDDDNIDKIQVSGNLTLMQTIQELDSEKVASETNGYFYSNFNKNKDALQGAAPILANMSLSYAKKWNEQKNTANISIIYNYISDRIYSLGHTSMGNQVDKAVNTVDFVVKTGFDKVGVSFKAQNLLNPSIDRVQVNETSNVLVNSYKRGRKINISITYKF
ncbi:MAG: TonB-dependent receptor [Bacteroidota bacterium]